MGMGRRFASSSRNSRRLMLDMRRRCASSRRNLAARLEWARSLDSQAEELERELIERTQWALSLQAELAQPGLSCAWRQIRSGFVWEGDLKLGPEIVTGSGQPE